MLPTERIPLNIITGFLGSGKTTLLQHMLGSPALTDAAVIINELGAVGIDDALVRHLSQDTTLLENGCLCCRLSTDLPRAVEEVEQRRRQLGMAPATRIVLETSGMADPAPILQSVLTEPALIRRVRLDSVTTTVDILQVCDHLSRYPEIARQIAVADTILITKTDLMEAPMMASVLPRLSALAPNAVVLKTPPIPPADCLLGAGLRNPNTGLLEPQRWLGASRSSPPQHTERINTVVIRPTQPLSWLDMETDLRSLLSISGDRILRVKGLLMPTDHACSIAVHAVHHQLHVPVALPESMAIKPVLVIVSDGLEEAVLRAAFRRW